MTANELRAALRVVTAQVNRALSYLDDDLLHASDVTPTLQQITDRISTAPKGHVFGWDACWTGGHTDVTWEQLSTAAGYAVLHAATLAQQLDRAVADAAGLIVAVHRAHPTRSEVMTMDDHQPPELAPRAR